MSDVTHWPTFPWTGDISTKVPAEFGSTDPPRPGDPGGPPCTACARADDDYVWVTSFGVCGQSRDDMALIWSPRPRRGGSRRSERSSASCIFRFEKVTVVFEEPPAT